MESDWEARVSALAEQLAADVSATVERARLTDRLVLFTLTPGNEGAASVRLLVSPFEVIVSAGEAMRYEFRPLAQCEERSVEFVTAVAAGERHERVWEHRARFDLRLADETVGRSVGRSVGGGRLPGLINPASKQSTWVSKRTLPLADVFDAWNALRDQVLAHDQLLGVWIETPLQSHRFTSADTFDS